MNEKEKKKASRKAFKGYTKKDKLLWHLQSSLRHLQGEEREIAVTTIMKIKRAIPRVPFKMPTLNTKYRIWYQAFTIVPKLTARLRNLLRIGC